MQNFFGFDREKYVIKKEVKRAANGIGAAYSSVLAISFFLHLVVILITALFSGFLNMMVIAEDSVFSLVMQIVTSIIVFTVPYIVVAKILKYNISNLVELRKPKKETFLPLLCVGFGVCALSEIFTNIFASTLSSVGINPDMPHMESGDSIEGKVLYFLAIAVVAPLAEEFALRGIVLSMLKKFGEGFAIVMSALIFGFMHGNLIQIPFAFIAGLALGFVAVKCGSLWGAVLLHAIVNTVSILTQFISDAFSMEIANVAYSVYLIVALIVGVFGLLFLTRKGETLSLEKSELNVTTAEKTKYFFSSAFIIISLIITAIEIIAVQVLY